MNCDLITTALLILALNAGCDYIAPSGEDISVNLGVKSQEPFQDTHKLYIRFAEESSSQRTPSKYINGINKSGWSWAAGRNNPFRRSDSLTATACLQPNLIGFVDVLKSEGPSVNKDIVLTKATQADLMVSSPANGEFVLDEFSLIDLPHFNLSIAGTPGEIISVCSVNFSHFPEVDYAIEFEIDAGAVVMEQEDLSLFDISLGNAKANGINETEVTVMGITKVDGERVGFTASASLLITSE